MRMRDIYIQEQVNGSEQIRVSSLILNVEVSQVIRDILESFYVCVFVCSTADCVYYFNQTLPFNKNLSIVIESEEKHIDIVKEYTQKKVKSYHSSN